MHCELMHVVILVVWQMKKLGRTGKSMVIQMDLEVCLPIIPFFYPVI